MEKRKALVKGVKFAAVTIASAALAAKRLHDKGYDKRALAALHNFSEKIKSEAQVFHEMVQEEIKRQEQADKKNSKSKR